MQFENPAAETSESTCPAKNIGIKWLAKAAWNLTKN